LIRNCQINHSTLIKLIRALNLSNACVVKLIDFFNFDYYRFLLFLIDDMFFRRKIS